LQSTTPNGLSGLGVGKKALRVVLKAKNPVLSRRIGIGRDPLAGRCIFFPVAIDSGDNNEALVISSLSVLAHGRMAQAAAIIDSLPQHVAIGSASILIAREIFCRRESEMHSLEIPKPLTPFDHRGGRAQPRYRIVCLCCGLFCIQLGLGAASYV
jgi:hypothetical protein